MDPRGLAAVAAFALAPLSSCISLPPPAFDWAYSEHHVRIDAERDVLQWLEIEHGLGSPTHDAPRQLRAVLAGKRVYPPGGGFMSFDAEAWLAISPREQDDETRRLVELIPSVHVDEAQLVTDEAGRSSLWRRTRFERASAWLDIIVNEPFLRDLERTTPDDPVWDVETLHRMRTAAANGWSPCSLQVDCVVFEAPMTPASATRYQESLAADDVVWRGLPHVEYRDGWLRARVRPAANGWIQMWKPQDSTGVVARPLDSLVREMGLSVEPTASYLARRAAAGLD